MLKKEEVYSEINVGNEMIHLSLVDAARGLLLVIVKEELLEFRETDIAVSVEIYHFEEFLHLLFVDLPASERQVIAQVEQTHQSIAVLVDFTEHLLRRFGLQLPRKQSADSDTSLIVLLTFLVLRRRSRTACCKAQ